ncbi:MAG: type II toxin-antitoxin system Phd/YefM family antitoxin [Dehalococcoidia bacterium]|jgi:PHD/YefM family antitoxin component YafN of YafNO toxin-antitoxin module
MSTVMEQYVIDTKGKKTGVILSLKRYQQLMEDLHDLAIVAERREEKPVSLEEMKRRLKKDAIL